MPDRKVVKMQQWTWRRQERQPSETWSKMDSRVGYHNARPTKGMVSGRFSRAATPPGQVATFAGSAETPQHAAKNS